MVSVAEFNEIEWLRVHFSLHIVHKSSSELVFPRFHYLQKILSLHNSQIRFGLKLLKWDSTGSVTGVWHCPELCDNSLESNTLLNE